MGQRWESPLEHHEDDAFAHGAVLTPIRTRLGNLENWRWFISGGLAILALEVTVFGVILAIHFNL